MTSLLSLVTALFLADLLCLALFSASVKGESLEVMPDKELEALIKQENYVLVLFGPGLGAPKDAQQKTADLETELAAVREELVDSLNAWVVRAEENSPMKAQVASWQAGPAVVFFRKQVPVLYEGPADEELILESISLFKEPCVRDLNDDTFEHQTQAATGATTGDWFVLFVRDDCEECQAVRASWESLACKFKGRINVARVNRASTGAVTGRRFNVAQVPSAVL